MPRRQVFASYEAFLESGKGKEPTLHPPKPEDFVCIMYTRSALAAAHQC